MSDDFKGCTSLGQAISNDRKWIQFAPSDMQIQAKRRVILDTLLFFLIMMGRWMKNGNINGKWDQHQESGARHDEHLNWNIRFVLLGNWLRFWGYCWPQNQAIKWLSCFAK